MRSSNNGTCEKSMKNLERGGKTINEIHQLEREFSLSGEKIKALTILSFIVLISALPAALISPPFAFGMISVGILGMTCVVGIMLGRDSNLLKRAELNKQLEYLIRGYFL
jgi:hypothetical protein